MKNGPSFEIRREEVDKEGRLHIMGVGQQHPRGEDNEEVSRRQERGLHNVTFWAFFFYISVLNIVKDFFNEIENYSSKYNLRYYSFRIVLYNNETE